MDAWILNELKDFEQCFDAVNAGFIIQFHPADFDSSMQFYTVPSKWNTFNFFLAAEVIKYIWYFGQFRENMGEIDGTKLQLLLANLFTSEFYLKFVAFIYPKRLPFLAYYEVEEFMFLIFAFKISDLNRKQLSM